MGIIRRIDLTMDEQRKYEVIKKLVEGKGNKNAAALKLGITPRHVNRLIEAYKKKGKEAFVHGNRGRKPSRTTTDRVRQDVVDLYRTKYIDSNFTHYTELLREHEGINLSVSCVTSILEAENILSPRVTKAKKKRVKKQLEKEKEAAKTQKEAERIQKNISQWKMLTPGGPVVRISENWSRWMHPPIYGSEQRRRPSTSLLTMLQAELQGLTSTLRRL